MRKLAAVSLANGAEGSFLAAVGAVETWLRRKGLASALRSDGVEVAAELELDRGRRAEISHRAFTTDVGELRSWELAEPTEGGQFRTTVQVAAVQDRTISFVTMEAGRPDNLVAPTFVEARIPAVVRDILGVTGGWACGETLVDSVAMTFRGAAGGAQLVSLLTDARRAVPVIVISDYEGLVLHPGIEQKLAADVAGLAIVARANEDACWFLTQKLTAQMSCYHGAIRLYWPGPLARDDFRRHPLWTSANLLWHDSDTEGASRRIRTTIRRAIFAAAAMGIGKPREIEAIERAHRRALFAAAASAESHKSVEDLFDEMDREVQRLNEENATLKDQVARLQVDLENVKTISSFQAGDWAGGSEDVRAAVEAPPETLAEAVERAQHLFGSKVIFGASVMSEGVPGMDPDAGPPEKVLTHLRALADLAEARAAGPIGKGMGQWLRDRGVHNSDETALLKASAEEKRKRIWDVGGSKRFLTLHTKPNEGTSPSKCVRIYFDWDDDRGCVVVGWIGRHP